MWYVNSEEEVHEQFWQGNLPKEEVEMEVYG